MDSKMVSYKPMSTSVVADGQLSVRGKSTEGPIDEDDVSNADHLTNLLNDITIHPKQDGDGETGKHSIIEPCVAGGKGCNTHGVLPSQGSQNSCQNTWDEVIDVKGSADGGNSKQQHSNSIWDSCGSAYKAHDEGKWLPYLNDSVAKSEARFDELPSKDSDDNFDEEDDDELLYYSDESDDSDAFDSDENLKSHEIRKKNKWLRPFFKSFDSLTLDQINDQIRQWHCPACQDGPGAIGWYVGLQSLMAHAKTKGKIRMRLHREFAELLEEEIQRKGISAISAGEAFGRWKGLRDTTADHEIVWPPMVVIMNTILEKDEEDKWKGMGNQELLEYFNTYEAVKARHSYGPHGHRGMSVLIFEASTRGYLEAERLHRQFIDEGRDRDAWERHRGLLCLGGKRQLYGFLASKEDILIFNRHSHGKAALKFDMRSYQEMVLGPVKLMSEENQKLIWLKNEVARQKQRSKALEQTLRMVSQNLRDTMEKNKIVILRTKIQHEENKEEMDCQKKFFRDQIDKIHKVEEEKEKTFEMVLPEEWAKDKQYDVRSGTIEDHYLRKEELERFATHLSKGIEEFESDIKRLIHEHEQDQMDLKRRHYAQEIELVRGFNAGLSKLIDKYAPANSQAFN
ncbi:Protein suppresor of gene silencing 3 like [Apostasia shenzhenica]|uniref:Protein suppresor of gene silencing 3 like n=1 Tax=Apostasia shenzhenica TaxID=1088818 RepID=A0A2I0AM66_9ASPA|nr:Protein suppresor of gene silencing 3 like [Apostasia shenzhenica]